MTDPIRFWPGSRPLTTLDAQSALDLTAAVGQRQASYRFALIDGVTGQHLGDITPIRVPARLDHNTAQTTKRRLSIALGKTDLAAIDQIRDRVLPYMVIPGAGQYPLGRYMFTVPQAQLFAIQQRIGSLDLTDEMFLIDQPLTAGVNGINLGIMQVITGVVTPLPVRFAMAASPYLCAQSWSIGAQRGSAVLESLAFTGDYWSPWLDNNGVLQFVRTFDPSAQAVDIDLDTSRQVIQRSSVETNDLLTAPNTFLVISNGGNNSTEVGSANGEIVARASVPPSAPHSVTNRGFEVVKVVQTQLTSLAQANAVVQGLAQRQTVFETVTLSTPPDPRHDGYNVIRWNGANWLELAWSLELVDGSEMTHTLRKSYAS